MIHYMLLMDMMMHNRIIHQQLIYGCLIMLMVIAKMCTLLVVMVMDILDHYPLVAQPSVVRMEWCMVLDTISMCRDVILITIHKKILAYNQELLIQLAHYGIR